MKAIRVESFGGPEVLKLKDVPIPVPGTKEVLIKVSAAGVSPIDAYVREGGLAGICSPPYIPGGDVAGVVHKVGQHVTKFKSGDRVYTMGRNIRGAYAQYAAFEESEVFPLHPDLTFAQGAAIGIPYFTAHTSLFKYGNAKAGNTILVHGASGGVGVAACQVGNAHGLKVMGTAGSKKGMDLILKNGAHKAFNHRQGSHYAEIQESVGKCGVDIILEMGSNKNLQDDLELLAQHGRTIVIGGLHMQTLGGTSSINVNPSTMIAKETIIRGVHILKTSDSEMAEMGTVLNNGMQQGWLRPQISREFTLADASKAHIEILAQQTTSHSGSQGKIVLTI